MERAARITCLIAWCLVFPSSASEADTDYYWKDYYKNQIPSDAIPGGYDKHGNTTYIAAVVHPIGKGLLPANLYPGSFAIAHAGYQGGNVNHIHTQYVKVLCSKHHKRYRWVSTNIKNIFQLNGTLVRGGQEWYQGLYIGRSLYMGEMKVGKILLEQPHYALFLPDTVASGAFKKFQDFEVLVYYEPCSLCWYD